MKKRIERKRTTQSSSRVSVRLNWFLLVLLAAGILAYWNSFSVPFVFDDFGTVRMNSTVRFDHDLFRPRGLLYATFAANNWLGGQNVWGYHLFNLLLHLLNGVLIFYLGRKVFSLAHGANDVDVYALLAAALFLTHPVQTESVTYISSRSELLSTVFYVFALLLFARRPPEEIGFKFSLIMMVVFVAGLAAKETVISLPAALLAYDFVFFSGGQIRKVLSRWRFYMTFVVAGLAAAFYMLTVSLAVSVLSAPGNLRPYSYFLTEARVIIRYLQITFLPLGLNLAYDFKPSTTLMDPRVIVSGLLLVGLIGLAWWLRKTKPIISFSIFWFFITLAATSSFVPLLDVAAEHRLYLPLAGVCLSFPLLTDFLQVLSNSKLGFRMSPAILGGILVAVLIAGTVARNQVWQDEARLWSDVIAKSPSYARGYMGLAQTYYLRGQYDKAIEISRLGLKNVKDNDLGFYSNIGQFELGLGRTDEALDAFNNVIDQTATDTGRARAYYNIAVTYLYKWNALKARESQTDPNRFVQEKDEFLSRTEDALLKSMELDDTYLPAWDSYMDIAVERGRQAPLRNRLQQQLSETPGKAAYGLAKLAFQEGNYKEAADYFGQATKLYPREKMVFFNYAFALEELGETDRAIDNYLTAVRLDPLFLQAHHNVAQIYMQKGLHEPAIEHFSEVLRLDPASAVAHLQLARLYIKQGQRVLAREHLTAILSVSPGNQEAAALWQQVGS
jgi:protein O-mannosyl-transferase